MQIHSRACRRAYVSLSSCFSLPPSSRNSVCNSSSWMLGSGLAVSPGPRTGDHHENHNWLKSHLRSLPPFFLTRQGNCVLALLSTSPNLRLCIEQFVPNGPRGTHRMPRLACACGAPFCTGGPFLLFPWREFLFRTSAIWHGVRHSSRAYLPNFLTSPEISGAQGDRGSGLMCVPTHTAKHIESQSDTIMTLPSFKETQLEPIMLPLMTRPHQMYISIHAF